MTQASPELSVVVTVTSGGLHVDRCLRALGEQRDAPPLEIIVPIDGSLPDQDVMRWREHFPEVHFAACAAGQDRPDDRAPTDPAARHLRYDLRRAAGLAAASAPIIALTEDHARPAPDWCHHIARAHAAQPHPAIGGAIDNASSDRLARAVYLCDFGRYQTPLREGPAEYLSDVNVSYKRGALEAVGDQWRNGYHETAVHAALKARGGVLWLDPSIVVEQQRGTLELGPSLAERYAWGRLYAGKRCLELSPRRRAALALLSPLLPVLLFARQLGRLGAAWRQQRRGAAGALPLVAILLCAWSLGESVGYWTGRPVSDARTRPRERDV